jgi:hypothetical protein
MQDYMFKKITNAIAVLLKNDADLSTFCMTNLGSVLNTQDNAIGIPSHIVGYPKFVVTKGKESHFFNKGTQNGLKNNFNVNIAFYGDFSGTQVNDTEFNLPTGAKVTTNGITTFTPTDIMREIAVYAGNLIDQKIACDIPQLRLEVFEVDAGWYYAEENGVVGSILELTLYQENRGYGN